MILSFSDTMPNRSYPRAGSLGVHNQRAFCLEANLKGKRDLSEFVEKSISTFWSNAIWPGESPPFLGTSEQLFRGGRDPSKICLAELRLGRTLG
jgi:hypothetical protein